MLDESDYKNLEEIAFVLADRSKPTLVCISVGSYRKRDELRKELDRLFPNRPSGLLNISGHPITSLFRTIREQAPPEALNTAPGEYLLHIYGIEDSLLLSKDGKIAASSLLAELNLERENLFHEFPCCLILWTIPHFISKLRTDAPDLWDWITYSYHFPDVQCEAADSELPSLEPMPQGVTQERKKRIADLEKRLQSMSLDGHSSERILRTVFSLHTALGGEYLAAFWYEDAIQHFRAALALIRQVGQSEYEQAESLFKVGTACLRARQFNEALESYEESLRLQGQATENIGKTWHQIGIVHQGQNNWPQALESYQKALDLHEKSGQIRELGSTWHQIGRVQQEQKNWLQALECYQKALELKETTGQVHQIGGTWHQIGMVQQGRKNWPQALQSYRKALEWEDKTGQLHELGNTWHQIGRVQQEQRIWSEALESYQKALEWKEKTGQKHELGSTLHQIGKIHEEQGAVSEALKYYVSAYMGLTEWQRPIVVMSLRRVFIQLTSAEKKELKKQLKKQLGLELYLALQQEEA